MIAKNKPPISLKEYADRTRPQRGPKCWMCSIKPSIRAEMEAARKEDPGHYTLSVIAGHMRDNLGLSGASFSKVMHHFRHHVAA